LSPTGTMATSRSPPVAAAASRAMRAAPVLTWWTFRFWWVLPSGKIEITPPPLRTSRAAAKAPALSTLPA